MYSEGVTLLYIHMKHIVFSDCGGSGACTAPFHAIQTMTKDLNQRVCCCVGRELVLFYGSLNECVIVCSAFF